jgi:formiminotetrahydrofolate cyclodeaminase
MIYDEVCVSSSGSHPQEAVVDFLNEIATLQPLPAGGAACAYTANLGMALLYKVLLLEINREELPPGRQANLRYAQKEIERLYLDLKKLIKEDPECYVSFSAGVRSQDPRAGKAAFLNVVTCSIQVIEKAYSGLDWVRNLARASSPRLAPNLLVAAELLAAALLGTAHVVRENIGRIRSVEKRRGYLDTIERLCTDGLAKKEEALAALAAGSPG